jgi:choline dehydrogenase
LLEAGSDERVAAVRNATLWMSNIGSERDWQFEAEPSSALLGRRASLPMGKVLGGGSSINGLVWARGHQTDFDRWAEQTGDPGWSMHRSWSATRKSNTGTARRTLHAAVRGVPSM